MKTSALIYRLANEIETYGDLELTFEVLDKNFNKVIVMEHPDISVSKNLNSIRITIQKK